MQPGKRNRRITLQKYAITIDDEGLQKKDWVDIATVWANMTNYNNKEKFQSGTIHDKQTCEMNIRYMPNVTNAERVKYKDTYYDVLSVKNINEQNREILLLCGVIDNVG